MNNRRIFVTLAGALAIYGCAPYADPMAVPAAMSFAADVRDASGTGRASATATQTGNGLHISIAAMNMVPGAYGAHVHAVGRCDAPGFESAGPHWNPTNRQHGKDNQGGMHKGDLPNLMIGMDGRGTMEFTIPDASAAGATARMMDGDGAAIVIHAAPDDYRTDPSGNSGSRIACGVFR